MPSYEIELGFPECGYCPLGHCVVYGLVTVFGERKLNLPEHWSKTYSTYLSAANKLIDIVLWFRGMASYAEETMPAT